MSDLIDRPSLLESLRVNCLEGKKLIENGEVHLDNFAEGYLECSELIRLAPAVEPKKACGLCKWRDEPSISFRCKDCKKGDNHPNFEQAYIELKKGEWIDWSETIGGRRHEVCECSNCHFTTDRLCFTDYCPACGADMRGERMKISEGMSVEVHCPMCGPDKDGTCIPAEQPCVKVPIPVCEAVRNTYKSFTELTSEDPSDLSEYCPPITLVEQISKQINMDIENSVCSAVLNVGIEVDKEELIKALNYDRGQYEAGWHEGYQKGYVSAWSDADVNRLRADLRSLREQLDAAVTQLRKSTDCEYCRHRKLPLPNMACSMCSPEHDMWKWEGEQNDEN